MPQRLRQGEIKSIALGPQNALWVSTDYGVFSFQDQTWTAWPTDLGLPSEYVSAAPDGTVWGLQGCQVWHFDGKRWTVPRHRLNEWNCLPNWGTAIAAAPDGSVWIGMQHQGLYHFDGKVWGHYTTENGLASDTVNAISVASDGTAWIATVDGLSRFDDHDHPDRTWTTFDVADGLADDYVKTVAVAPDGTVWAGTWGQGISRFDGQTWQTYTVTDGLGSDWIMAVTVASDGTVWASTWGSGVSRFDGQRWTIFTTADGLAGNWITALATFPDGQLWVGTKKSGLSYYEPPQVSESEQGLAAEATSLPYPIDKEKAVQLLEEQFKADLGRLKRPTRGSCIGYGREEQDEKDFYAGKLDEAIANLLTHPLAKSLDMTTLASICQSDYTLTSFPGEKDALLVVRVPVAACQQGSHDPGPGINIDVFDRTGQSWGIGHAGRILPSNVHWLDGEWIVPLDLSSSPTSGNRLYAVWHVGQEADQWKRTHEFIPEQNFAWEPILDVRAGKPRLSVTLISMEGPPPCEFDAQVRDVYHHTNNEIQTTYEWDGEMYAPIGHEIIESVIWVEGNDGHLKTLDSWTGHCLSGERKASEAWANYTVKDGLASNYTDALTVAPDGTVWTNSGNGVSHFDVHTWTFYTEAHGLVGTWVQAIAVAADGSVWFGVYGSGVSRYDGNTWTSYTEDDGMPCDNINDIAASPDGTMWFATDDGISHFDGNTWTSYLDGTLVASIATGPDGTVWAGTFGSTFRFDGTWQVYDSQDVADIAIAADGTTWVGYRSYYPACSGSSGGLARFDRGHTPKEGGAVFVQEDGLVCNAVEAIATAPDGSVWIGTERGVSHFDNGQWTTYTSVDGLIYPSINAIAVAPDGSVWFATSEGISHYTPKK